MKNTGKHGSFRLYLRPAGMALMGVLLTVGTATLLAPRKPKAATFVDLPSPLATWPWPGAVQDQPHAGIAHWLDRSSPDGTLLDLLEFDFTANPRLRLELYDQDEDDAAPFDNRVAYWPLGVAAAVQHLDQAGRGPVLAAWNGLFFGTDSGNWGPEGVGHPVAPVVLRGQVRHNVGNHRWTFGVKQQSDGPEFKLFHLPDRATLAREYTFAAAGAPCVLREGQPLRVEPIPGPDSPSRPSPVPSTPEEAGYIPGVDHIKTCRTSLGWSRDSRKLYLLVVKEPDHELASRIDQRFGKPMQGGWSLADIQRFWQARGVWSAVNLDGGNVTQLLYQRSDRHYELVPPRWSSSELRKTLSPDLKGAPEGGTLMYFYVREVPNS